MMPLQVPSTSPINRADVHRVASSKFEERHFVYLTDTFQHRGFGKIERAAIRGWRSLRSAP